MNKIFTTTTKGDLIELGLGLLPEIIAAIREPNPNLPKLLAESDLNADILIGRGKEELDKLKST
jgi:hypothetical protein